MPHKDFRKGRAAGKSVPAGTPIARPPAPGRDWGNAKLWCCLSLLAALTFTIYWPALTHPFVNYDDPDYVTQNPHVQQGITLSTIEWAAVSTSAANWHPVTWISHALDCQLFGLNPAGHHFTNILLHALNVLLLFALLAQATGKVARSFWVAALFALHPLNVECVAWIAERKSLLSMLLFLLALAAYGWYARSPGVRRYLVMAALFVLALAAKPMVVTFPFALLLLDVWPLQRIEAFSSTASPGRRIRLGRILLEKVPLMALAAISCGITVIAQRPALKTMEVAPLGARLGNAVYSYWAYLWKALWPTHLGVYYAPQGSLLSAPQILAGVCGLAATSALLVYFRSRPWFLVGWLWFLGTLIPMIGIVQVGEQGMADRYAYLPLLGIFVAAVWAVADLAAARRFDSRIPALAATLIIASLGIRTSRQIDTWQTSYALWSHSLQITPENYVAEDFVGTTLLEEGFRSTGDGCIPAAQLHFESAVHINSRDSQGHLNLGYCYQAHRRLQQAVAEYTAAVDCAPNAYLRNRGLINLGAAYEQLGDWGKARNFYAQALQIFPHDSGVLAHLAELPLVP
jgi:tetratricopeptide (TPR) repeat protein